VYDTQWLPSAKKKNEKPSLTKCSISVTSQGSLFCGTVFLGMFAKLQKVT